MHMMEPITLVVQLPGLLRIVLGGGGRADLSHLVREDDAARRHVRRVLHLHEDDILEGLKSTGDLLAVQHVGSHCGATDREKGRSVCVSVWK